MIYHELIALDKPHADLQGLILSCRKIKTEVYDEMARELRKLQDYVNDRWPFDYQLKLHMVFPGRLFSSREVIIKVPYHPAKVLFARDDDSEEMYQLYSLHSSIHLPHIERITLHVGHINGSPSLEEQLGDRNANGALCGGLDDVNGLWDGTTETYLSELLEEYAFAMDNNRGDTLPQKKVIRLKDGYLAKEHEVEMLVWDDSLEEKERGWDHLAHPTTRV